MLFHFKSKNYFSVSELNFWLNDFKAEDLLHHTESIKSLCSSFKPSSRSVLKPAESFLLLEFRMNEHGRLCFSLCPGKTLEVRNVTFNALFSKEVLEPLERAAEEATPAFISHYLIQENSDSCIFPLLHHNLKHWWKRKVREETEISTKGQIITAVWNSVDRRRCFKHTSRHSAVSCIQKRQRTILLPLFPTAQMWRHARHRRRPPRLHRRRNGMAEPKVGTSPSLITEIRLGVRAATWTAGRESGKGRASKSNILQIISYAWVWQHESEVEQCHVIGNQSSRGGKQRRKLQRHEWRIMLARRCNEFQTMINSSQTNGEKAARSRRTANVCSSLRDCRRERSWGKGRSADLGAQGPGKHFGNWPLQLIQACLITTTLQPIK